MAVRCPSLVAAASVVGATGHGSMYEPPSRNSGGMSLGTPSCAGFSCFWFSEGCSIGCDKCTGEGPTFADPPDAQCAQPAEPTIAFDETELRTYNLELNFSGHPVDWTRYHPWRFPGSAPVEDPCGISGGWYTPCEAGAGCVPGPGVPQGVLGSDSPFAAKLLEQTQWVVGSVVEVAFGISANHGGGYQYRLCPADDELTEECFQKMPLEFVGDESWIQFGHGMDTSNRSVFKPTPVSGSRVVPAGSVWYRNPVPACKAPVSGGVRHASCKEPMFEPLVPGVWGFGQGHCQDGSNASDACTPEQAKRWYLDWGVVDKLKVPDIPEGDYVLGFRWDSEQTPQVWSSCADVSIKSTGKGSKSFTPVRGCTQCCAAGGICSNCTGCLDDKSGACAYCWGELPGFTEGGPAVTCLGNEDSDGRAPTFHPGDDVGLWSLGCPSCWAEDGGCEAFLRELEDDVLVMA